MGRTKHLARWRSTSREGVGRAGSRGLPRTGTVHSSGNELRARLVGFGPPPRADLASIVAATVRQDYGERPLGARSVVRT